MSVPSRVSCWQLKVLGPCWDGTAWINQEVNSLSKWREFPVHRHNSVRRHRRVSPAAGSVGPAPRPLSTMIGSLGEAPSEILARAARHWLVMAANCHSGTAHHGQPTPTPTVNEGSADDNKDFCHVNQDGWRTLIMNLQRSEVTLISAVIISRTV